MDVVKEQGQTAGSQLEIIVRPLGNQGSAINHELCVIFPCGREVVVNRGTEYALELFKDNDSVIKWACELLLRHENGCPLFSRGII